MSIHIPSVDGDAEPAITSSRLPEILPVLPLRDSVPFPDTLTPLAVGQERSVQLVNDVLGSNRMLVMVASKNPDDEEPGPDDVYRVGVAGVVSRMMKVPDGTLRILVHGAQRVELEEFMTTAPYLVARMEEAADVVEPCPELEALHRNVQATFTRIVEEVPYLPEELQIAVTNLDDPSELSHMIAGALRLKTEEKQRAPRGARRDPSPADALRGPGPRARAGGDRHPDPDPGPVGDGQGPARVLAAPADEGHPGGAG